MVSLERSTSVEGFLLLSEPILSQGCYETALVTHKQADAFKNADIVAAQLW